MKPMQPSAALQTAPQYQNENVRKEAFVCSVEEQTKAQLPAVEELIWLMWPHLLAGEDSKFILAASGTPPT